MARREVDDWLWQVGNELQRMSEEFGAGRPLLASRRAWEPRIDLIDDDRRLILRAEIAGVRGEEIQLHYVPERHALILRGRREEESVSGPTGFYQLEILYGEFQREVALPEGSVDADGIRAQYRNGFLIVVIPKLERGSPRAVTVKEI